MVNSVKVSLVTNKGMYWIQTHNFFYKVLNENSLEYLRDLLKFYLQIGFYTLWVLMWSHLKLNTMLMKILSKILKK